MQTQQFCREACLEAARLVRAQAALLRLTADAAYVPDQRRLDLAREAEGADRQADRWLDAADEE